MLDFDALTIPNTERLRLKAWKQAIQNRQTNSLGFSNAALDGLPLEIRQLLESSPLDSGFFIHKSAQQTFDPLQVLGLPKDKMPTADEIKANYRRLAMKYHPDRNPEDVGATEQFRRANTAYKDLSNIHAEVEGKLASLEEKIGQHFAANHATSGWSELHTSSGDKVTAFPVDHIPEDQKQALIQTLVSEGYSVEDHISKDVGNVISVSKVGQERISAEEVSGRLKARFRPEVIESKLANTIENAVETVEKDAGTMEGKAANTIADAVKSGEKAAEKSSGKTKWIVGGIIAATVAVGAFIMYKRKSASEIERERKQDSTAAQGIS